MRRMARLPLKLAFMGQGTFCREVEIKVVMPPFQFQNGPIVTLECRMAFHYKELGLGYFRFDQHPDHVSRHRTGALPRRTPAGRCEDEADHPDYRRLDRHCLAAEIHCRILMTCRTCALSGQRCAHGSA